MLKMALSMKTTYVVLLLTTVHTICNVSCAPVVKESLPLLEIGRMFLDAPPEMYPPNTKAHVQDTNQQDIIPLPLNLDELAAVLQDNPAAVYLKFNFTQAGLWGDNSGQNVAFLSTDEYLSYIDPLTFLIVSPGLGYLLLSLPFDFVPLSLTSLGINVATVTMDMADMIDPADFMELTDKEQLQIMYDLASEIITASSSKTSQMLLKTSAITLTEYVVCTQKLDENSGGYIFIRRLLAAIMNTRYLLLQSLYDCRPYGAIDEVLIPEQYWLNRQLPFIFGFVVFCFAPLLLRFFHRGNPPFQDQNGAQRITPSSNLPVGIKYTCLFSYGDSKWVKGMKATIGLFTLVFLSYLQPLIAYLTNKDDFTYRVQAAERMDPIGYWVYIGIMVGYYFLFLLMFVIYVYNILLSNKSGPAWESESDRKMLTFMRIPQKLWVPVAPNHLSYTQTIIHYSKHRMLMSLDLRIWRYEFFRLWQWITSGPDCDTRYLCKYTFGIITYLLLFIPYGLLILVRLFFNSLPSFYITKHCLTDYKCKIPVGAITIVLAALRIPPIVWYIITLIECTFVGLVVNHEVVLPPAIICSAIVYFGLKAYKQIYNDYLHLTQNIVAQVVKAQDKLEKLNKRQGGQTRQSAISGRHSQSLNLYIVSATGMPAIELDLWYFIINEIRPVHQRFFGKLITFGIASVILAIEFQFLWFINEHYDLTNAVFFFATVLLALSLPLMHSALTPDGSMKDKRAEEITHIKTLIAAYFKKHLKYDYKDGYGPRNIQYAATTYSRPRYIPSQLSGIDNDAFYDGTELKHFKFDQPIQQWHN